jgi:hypothetical protein
MSMPERIWRIVRGRWLMAEERLYDALAEQQAEQELSETLTASHPGTPLPSSPPGLRRAASAYSIPNPNSIIQNPKSEDPLAADLALLGAPPACGMELLDRLYAERMAEFRPDAYPVDSPQRAEVVGHRAALSAAYERLRDAINTTETRFEKLEF